MTAALAYEWRRLVTLRSTWWLVAVAVVVPVALAMLIALAIASASDVDEVDSFLLGAVATQGAAIGVTPLLVAYVMALLGVFCFGHEYRHGMIRATLTAVPSRPAVFVAKALVTALAAFAVALVTTGLGVLVGSAIGLDADGDVLSQLLLGTALYSMMFALVGLALAAIFRNQVAALVVVLVVPTVLESVLRAVLVIPPAFDDIEDLARYLPFDAGSQMYQQLSLGDALDVLGFEPLGPVAGGVTLAVFTAFLLAVAAALFVSRDA